MRLLAVLCLLGGASCNVIRTEQKTAKSDGDLGVKFIFEGWLKDKCRKVGVVDPYTGFFQALEGAFTCVGRHLQSSETDSSSSEELCDYHKNNIRHCFDDILANIKECLDPEEKYLPEFIFNAMDGLLKLACSDDSIEDALERPSATKCIDDAFNDTKLLDACFDNVSLQSFNFEDNFVLKEEELCYYLFTFYNCSDNYLRKRCSYDREVRKVLRKVYQAVTSPCENIGRQREKRSIV
ncbi:uncharacterized protein LOC116176411 [Photinus pyralis]|uniref:uncharacterized protein LOC116176411 n=1 Tax=Photinus pyralis TaxID=7054 RepID=UPI0012673280|nr:uncharacterized protein LOC116176411 [Photinus pyralis]